MPSAGCSKSNGGAFPKSCYRIELASIHPTLIPVGQANLNPISASQREFRHRFAGQHFVDTFRPIRRLCPKRNVAQMGPSFSQCA